MEMIIITIINTIALLITIMYLTKKNSIDKIETIREVSRAIMAKNIEEYEEVIAEDKELEIEGLQNELMPLEEVDEKILIKHLKKEYENNENKN